MKITAVFIVAILVLATAAFGGTGNYPFFITDNGDVFQDSTNGTCSIRSEKIEEAKKSPDSRPAELDPNGNWGSTNLGFQASLRSSKVAFSTNEHVDATLIVRNVGVQERSVLFNSPDLVSCIVVIGPNGTALTRIDVPKSKSARESALRAMAVQPERFWISPGMQRKFQLNLTSHFDFHVPGKYLVFAKPRVLGPASKTYSAIESGKATIEILTPTSGDSSPKKN